MKNKNTFKRLLLFQYFCISIFIFTLFACKNLNIKNNTDLIYVKRSDWTDIKAPAANELQNLEEINTIVIHNTETLDRTKYEVPKILNMHLERGWSDIGYHYLIALDPKDNLWKVYLGRPMNVVGAHVGSGKNLNTLGIAMVGDYVWKIPNQNTKPPAEAIQVLNKLVDSLMKDPRLKKLKSIKAHGAIAYKELYPHASDHEILDFAINPEHTDCPGHGLVEIVKDLQKRY